MPGHTFLYSPPVLKIKELIDAGALGDIYFISMSRVNLGLHQPDVSVVWDLGPTTSRSSATGSACSRPRSAPSAAPARARNAGRRVHQPRYGSGTIAHVELSWLSPSKLRRTAIVGSRKMVVYDDTSSEPVRIFDSGASLPDPETFGEYQLTYRTGDIVSPKIEATEPLALEILDFCSATFWAARAFVGRARTRRRADDRGRRPVARAGGAPVRFPDRGGFRQLEGRAGCDRARCAEPNASASLYQAPRPATPAAPPGRRDRARSARGSRRRPGRSDRRLRLACRGQQGAVFEAEEPSAESRRPSSSTAIASISAATASSRSCSRSSSSGRTCSATSS